MGDFFSYYISGNTGLNSSRTFRVLFHCQTSSVWCIIEPWIVLQTNNACKSVNFITKMCALLRSIIVLLFHCIVSSFDPLPRDDIQFFLRKMQGFQQDGVTCHTARVTMDLLRGKFGEHFISRSGRVNWPPRSCDLTSLDCFLWGYVKAHVYIDKPASIDALKDKIEAFICEIPAKMLEIEWRRSRWTFWGAVAVNICMK